MKQYLRITAMLLVLLMTVSVAVACGDKDDKDDPKETERETEKETEKETEQEISKEEIEQLKAEMATSILEALQNAEQTTNPDASVPPADTEGNTKEEVTTNYGGIVEDLLGSLGGLGNGDYDYQKIITEVLDKYIGSESTSDFIKEMIKSWLDSQGGKAEQTTEEQTTEEKLPGNSADSLQDYIADKTAQAVADAVVERINEVIGGTVHDAVYESVYNAMKGNNGFMDSILGEMIPGYGDLSGILGGFGQ